MADDLGIGHVGSYGQKHIRTPSLDRMAAEGMRFTQAYAGSAVCAASRSVLMTGLHGGHTPIRGNSGGIPLIDEDVTVAEVLRDAGYATACFGKWGLGAIGTTGVPTKQGFDEFFGYLHQGHAHFYYPEFLWHNESKYELPGNANGGQGQYTHDIIMEKAFEYLRTPRDKPFFLYLPLTIPHYELLVPEDSLAEYRGKFPETPFEGRGERIGYPHDYAKQATPKAVAAAMITRMDRDIGRLFDILKEQGLDENTLVIFTSDNGAAGGPAEPEYFKASGIYRDDKGALYEGGIRVPTIARWPGKVDAGRTNDYAWYFADVMPTFSDLVGTEDSPEGDGISILPTLLGEAAVGRSQPEHPIMYWENGHGKKKFRQAVRRGDWKAVRPEPKAAVELYNISNDPSETKNVAEEHPDLTSELAALIVQEHVTARTQIEPVAPQWRDFR
jgi:arylsulfatase A-like enzyme